MPVVFASGRVLLEEEQAGAAAAAAAPAPAPARGADASGAPAPAPWAEVTVDTGAIMPTLGIMESATAPCCKR